MARKFHRRKPLEAMSELNVTPLIDLAFALLIIFMITAPLLQQTIDIRVPTESARPQPSEPIEPLMLSIDPQGQFFWGDQAVGDNEMQSRLVLVADTDEPPVVQIRADAGLPYQRVVDLLDLVKGAGLSKISLETRAR
ncbi:biopolymer transporter ExbD [Puniceicoccales bacterium CK1056]|uniref:Biopolymer transporter ExbD n=1 Tax=Oceanipulchritudo coccoides TaxID=2706888 RepID=A0A6B2M3P4_9BACT|nr:biopolymer transporter ExbD [Oceanipulchritudo coccoides]NDV62829.1 biopolymer transporter ExbD [Oceanipulchritudo coccoides]